MFMFLAVPDGNGPAQTVAEKHHRQARMTVFNPSDKTIQVVQVVVKRPHVSALPGRLAEPAQVECVKCNVLVPAVDSGFKELAGVLSSSVNEDQYTLGLFRD
jgi:hypothetical protein